MGIFNLICLSERKLRLQRLNVIDKEIKTFEKEFYNLLNLTNLPQGDLQLNRGGGGLSGGQLAQGAIVQGVVVWGVIAQGVIVQGGLSEGRLAWTIVQGELS